MSKKQKSCLIRSDLSENMSLLLQNSFVAITMSISQKSVQKRRLGEKYGFFKIKFNQNTGLLSLLQWEDWILGYLTSCDIYTNTLTFINKINI